MGLHLGTKIKRKCFMSRNIIHDKFTKEATKEKKTTPSYF